MIPYLRSIAGRCEHLAMTIRDDRAQKELRTLSADLIDKASILEATFHIERPVAGP